MEPNYVIVPKVDAIKFLKTGLPEIYEQLASCPDDGPYAVYGLLGDYLYSLPPEDPQWSGIVRFLNSMAATRGSDLETLLVVEIFENLPKDHPATVRMLEELEAEALRLLREHHD